MNQFSYDYDAPQRDLFAIDAEQSDRMAFIHRTYLHVFGAVGVFIALVAVMVNTPAIAVPLMGLMVGHWWVVLIAFMAASWAAHRMAESGASVGVQYAGLGLYAFAEAIIFTPILFYLHNLPNGRGDDIMVQAGLLSLVIFGGLTAFVLLTKSDFSFLRNILSVLMLAAIGLALVAAFTTISLGTWFAVGMIVLMCGFILYETSNVLHHYRTDQHVAASLALFSSLATLFWYVLQLMSAFDD